MNTVLLALHYQNEVLHPKGRIKVGMAEKDTRREHMIAAATRLFEICRGASIPVVSVRVAFRPDHADVIQNCKIFRDVAASKAMADGSWGAEFYEGLAPAEGEFVIKHTRVNAFHGSQLADVLTILKAQRVIVAGIATNSVVLTTVAAAADMGYEVIVVGDACSSGDPRLHESSLENMRLVSEVISVAQLTSLLT